MKHASLHDFVIFTHHLDFGTLFAGFWDFIRKPSKNRIDCCLNAESRNTRAFVGTDPGSVCRRVQLAKLVQEQRDVGSQFGPPPGQVLPLSSAEPFVNWALELPSYSLHS